ncbi:glycosyltransferase [Mucilaginibacter limnophilus]|uniref:Glycosyltransferase n=1 Tax=Mucilaginibacter limnophilus TaxID=1932778 RepID=A0A3S2XZC6_9SPHI|nr:glycosyltransferase [Mucilaginibacter limnophilus]RVT99756.1 glycosyltransferase [Mucilaginibacter limnophilus]
MNILHVVSSIDPKAGGVSQALRTMILGLSKGASNTVVCLDNPEEQVAIRDDFEIHKCGPTKNPWRYSVKFKAWMRDNIVRFDVIIIHGLWQYHSFCTYSVWKKFGNKRARLFVMPHGMLDPYFQKAKGRKIKALRNILFWRLLESKVVNEADGLLFTCETEKLLARTTFKGYRPKTENVVGLGVEEPPRYSLTMDNEVGRKIRNYKDRYILFIGRIDPKKGVDLLIDEYKNLISEYQNIPQLVIAGPGCDTEYGKEMIKKAASCQSIQFPGLLLGDQKWGAFYNAEAFILHSHQENFGVAVVEAMACGKPVIISNQVNIWREIQASGSGFVDEDTNNGVFKNMRKWLELPQEEKNKMSNNAKTAFKELFFIDKVSVRLLELLEKTRTV